MARGLGEVLRVRETATDMQQGQLLETDRARLLFHHLGDSLHAATKKKLVFKKSKRKEKQDTLQTNEETSRVA